MRYLYFGLSFLGILLVFLLTSRSIISARILDLKVRIQKDQIMNYELSSKTLRGKIRQIFQDKENFQEEMRLNVLESNVLNAGLEDWNPDIKPEEKFGFLVLNLVRGILGKDPIHLTHDRDSLVRIQFAFFQERRRKFSLARDTYRELEKSLNMNSEEMAFVLLHNGFCLAMMGLDSESLDTLEQVIQNFSGTHYSDNAIFLKKLILESRRKKSSIANQNLSGESKLQLYYKNGNYESVLDLASQMEGFSANSVYMVARSKEELGMTQEALKDYISLTNQNKDKKVAIAANRRLMLLGNFYTKEQSLVDYSIQKSRSLGDRESIQLVEEGKKMVKSPKILSLLDQSSQSKDRELIENHEAEMLTLDEKVKEKILVATPLPTESNSSITIRIELMDGRIIYAKGLTVESEMVRIEMTGFPINTPLTNLKEISTFSKIQKRNSEEMLKIHSSSGIFLSSRIIYSNSEFILSDNKGKKLPSGSRLRIGL